MLRTFSLVCTRRKRFWRTSLVSLQRIFLRLRHNRLWFIVLWCRFIRCGGCTLWCLIVESSTRVSVIGQRAWPRSLCSCRVASRCMGLLRLWMRCVRFGKSVRRSLRWTIRSFLRGTTFFPWLLACALTILPCLSLRAVVCLRTIAILTNFRCNWNAISLCAAG